MKFEHQNIIFNKKKKIINHHILNHHENNLWFNNRKTFSTINLVEKTGPTLNFNGDNYGQINFGDNNANAMGQINYNTQNNELSFTTNNISRMTINEDGDVTINQNVQVNQNLSVTNEISSGSLDISGHIDCASLTAVNNINGDNIGATQNVSCNTLTCTTSATIPTLNSTTVNATSVFAPAGLGTFSILGANACSVSGMFACYNFLINKPGADKICEINDDTSGDGFIDLYGTGDVKKYDFLQTEIVILIAEIWELGILHQHIN